MIPRYHISRCGLPEVNCNAADLDDHLIQAYIDGHRGLLLDRLLRRIHDLAEQASCAFEAQEYSTEEINLAELSEFFR